MYPCLLLKVLAEYDLQLCACSKRDSCVTVFLYSLARGYTPRLHLGGGGAGPESIYEDNPDEPRISESPIKV